MIEHIIPILVMSAVFYLGYKLGEREGYKHALEFVYCQLEKMYEQKNKLDALKGEQND